MRSRKNTVITFISSIVILASCTSANINHSNENFILEESLQAKDVKQYFSYKDFSAKAIRELDLYIKDSQLSSNELNDLKKLLSNIRKIASKEAFIIYTGKSNIYSFELIQLIYGLDLPIQI
jgi:predicted membrane chloride channel (bestrophin family)